MTLTVKELLEHLSQRRPDALVFLSTRNRKGKEVIAPIDGISNDSLRLVYLEGEEDATDAEFDGIIADLDDGRAGE